MTSQPPGPEATPAVAALAIQISRLRQDIDTITRKVSDLTTTQRGHAAKLSDLASIRKQIQQILTLLDTENDMSPARWFWLTMPDTERADKLSELTDWVETVLRVQYPDYLADQIKPCWPNHPEARWELTWLYQLWTLTYLTTRPTPKEAGDWHDRWTPGVIRRLSHVMTRCTTACSYRPDRQES